jgi:chromosome segregation protein
MRFEKLKLCGFKSFVEPAELRIEAGLTGVVGPNGCGKSNLLEALRWVMGESSPKSLRGGGMDDVIFAGSAIRPPRSFAEVVLFARRSSANDDGLTPHGEIEVVRRIERGAGSAWRLNGREARAKDIALIFADAATGAHSPALVSQGRIAAVIAARPAERREMLEEAAGIAGLHVRRRDAEGRLRATESNLARLDDLIAGLAVQIASLRRQARSAERYRALSERIKLAEARASFARWAEASAAAGAARQEAGQADSAVAGAQSAAAGAREAQHAAIASAATVRDKLAALRAAGGAQEHRRAALQGKLEVAEQRLTDIERQIDRLEADEGQASKVTREASEALVLLQRALTEVEAALAAEEQRHPMLLFAETEAERRTEAAEAILAQAQADQASLDAEWRVTQAAIASARTTLDRVRAERERRRSEAATLTSANDVEAEHEAAQASLLAATKRLAQAQAARDALVERRAEQAAARDKADEVLAVIRAEVLALEREVAALARERAVQGEQGAGIAALGSLRAEPGYERAVAAVLGPDASTRLGAPEPGASGRYWTGAPARDQLPDSVAAHVPVAPRELAARLAMVRFAELDDGRALSPGEWLVTRAGDLRRWDGLVVRGEGGRAASSLEATNRLAVLEKELPARQAARTQAEDRAAQATAALGAAQARLAQAERELATAATAERAALRACDQAESACERHRARSTALVSALAEIDQRAQQFGDELTAAESRLSALTDPAASQNVLEQARAAQASARRMWQAAAAARAAAERALAGWRERRFGLQADIRSWNSRVSDAERRLAEAALRHDELAGERAVAATKAAALRVEIGACSVESERLARELTETAAKAATCETAVAVADRRLAEEAEVLAACRERRAAAAARAESRENERAAAAHAVGERFGCPPAALPHRFGFVEAEIREASVESATVDRLLTERERLGAVNLVAAEELAAAEARHVELAAEQAELSEAVNRLRGSIGSLNREGRERLRAALAAVDGHFRRLFGRLFDGGNARLAMIDSDDPLEAGLEIYAQPPGKRLQSLSLLSGGEQALTAVALIFALFLTKPSPICVLDEVDAPLDDANVERFCDLLDAMVADIETRYLVVTHNPVTMSRMHRLFGVTMAEQGVSRLVSVDLDGAEALLAAAE